jgi:PAS domain S-box-containing protein
MSKQLNKNRQLNFPAFRVFAIYSVGLFLLLMLLSAFIVIPQINKLFESQHSKDINVELTQEVAMFMNFVENQRSIIDDLAKYPSLTSAVMLSDSDNRSVHELLDNMVIGGEKGKLVLQDIEGNTLVKTVEIFQAEYTNNPSWLLAILEGDVPYHFQLLSQNKQNISLKISVPIIFNRFIEGVLSSEMTVSLKDIFISQPQNINAAIKLTQNLLTIGTTTEHIELARENTIKLDSLGIIFTYITDDAPIKKTEQAIKNVVFSVLLGSLAISFFLFVVIAYSGLHKDEHASKKQRRFWKTYVMPIGVGLLGISATISACMMLLNIKQVANEKEFIFDSKENIQRIKDKLNSHLNILDAIKAFYDASHFIDPNEFKTFVTPLLTNYKNVQTIEWIPFVTSAQRNTHEKQAQLNGFRHYAIKEKNEQHLLIPASLREYYFPIHYVEPRQGNEKTIGFDLGSNNISLTALLKAKESGYIVATAKIVRAKETEQSSILVFNPIYHKSLEKNQSINLQGFALLELRIGDLIYEIQRNQPNGLSFFIQDISDPENPTILYGENSENDLFYRDEIIDIAGRIWRIGTYHKQKQTLDYLTVWFVLIIGLIFTGLITLGLTYLIRRREIVERLVHSRTAALSESEEQYRAVVENAIDGLLTIDQHGIIEKFNQAAQTIFGYNCEEIIGSNIKILMPENYHCVFDQYLNSHQSINMNNIMTIDRYVEGKRKDGSTFPMDFSISEIRLSNTKKFSAIIRDISKRVALENEREQFIDKLTSSNEELERFAFVCSHDLQEPLRMIRSFSEKLEIHLENKLENDEKGKKYFHFITDGAARSQTLIADILTYSSISNDTQLLENVNIENIVAMISKNVFDLSDQQHKNITFNSLPTLRGNKTQLLQLFQNIINNAMKYQKIDVVPHVHVSCEELEKHWQFKIKDNGIGIEERHFKKIFDVFQRLHRRSQFAGTGVGLSICKKVVERHGGDIWVDSEKGIGSTFYITLLK